MRYQSKREQENKIIQAEIDRCRRKYENAQVYYAYDSRSAERTMEKYATLEKALESYFAACDIQSELRDKLLEIGEAMKRAEKQIELYGEKSLSVRQIIAEVKRIINGGSPK